MPNFVTKQILHITNKITFYLIGKRSYKYNETISGLNTRVPISKYILA